MKKIMIHLALLLVVGFQLPAQTFIRSELPTSLDTPWEIIYGPDGYLWLTEKGGKVVRVDPSSGAKTVVYTAPDYFGGSPSEQLTLCFKPDIGAGTLGMALHPDFTTAATSYIYFVHPYNSGTSSVPATKFKIKRLTWNAATNTVIADTTLVPMMPTGYDHLGGRLMVIKQNGIPYLFFTVGDNGISETNSPACYTPQSGNPNNFAQDPAYKNGKVHRFNVDGSIPATNPMAGNSFYTRGHRNPQGLAFNSAQNIIYEIEHGDRSDDEINILQVGMNYGWKQVRGFHGDNNFPGESAFVSGYTPNPAIANDALKEPMFTWCTTPQQSTDTLFLNWCTVAPSDGLYYGSSGIPDWTNSLLVVTLKNGQSTDQEVYQIKLNAAGTAMEPSTASAPNPRKFFGSDQAMNGRLRDLAVSPDGTKIYLINNGGNTPDKITVYAYAGLSGLAAESANAPALDVYPNPFNSHIQIKCSEEIQQVQLHNLLGERVYARQGNATRLDLSSLPAGTYYLSVKTLTGKTVVKKLVNGIE